MNETASVYAVAYGLVQGVYYRDFTCRHAAQLGLTGFARNLPDGTVEVRAEGERNDLEKLIDHLREGPPSARVTKLETRWSKYSGKYDSFTIRH